MCCVIYLKIGVLRTSQGGPFRTPLGCPWDVSVQFMSKWINLIVFASWGYAESKSIRKVFEEALTVGVATSQTSLKVISHSLGPEQ